MFRGRNSHTIDKKGRVSIPAGFRVALQSSENPPILTIDQKCLALYSHEDFADMENGVGSDPGTAMQPELEEFLRVLVGNAIEAPIDRQGRILIPSHLREHANLQHKVVIAGVGRRIEIWDQAAYEYEQARTLQRFPEIKAAVAARRGS
jgi:MraZ protein